MSDELAQLEEATRLLRLIAEAVRMAPPGLPPSLVEVAGAMRPIGADEALLYARRMAAHPSFKRFAHAVRTAGSLVDLVEQATKPRETR